MNISSIAVVGAGNMGSGIAQKVAQSGIAVTLLDSERRLAVLGKGRIEKMLHQGCEGGLFTVDEAKAILGRVTPTGDMADLSDVDLVIEAIDENIKAKSHLFKQLGTTCGPETIIATNTSSFLVADLAKVTANPQRVIGLHYFYHPAKNRLVEVIGHEKSAKKYLQAAWALQHRMGKTPIASKDASGFVVNRFFVPWLNEAARLHDEGMPIDTIEQAAKESFGIHLGPFELMNITGVPIAFHAATAMEKYLGAFYAPATSLSQQVERKQLWPITKPNQKDDDALKGHDIDAITVAQRLWGVVFQVSLDLVSEGVGSIDDVDLGARVGLRWPVGPFEKMNHQGLATVADQCTEIAKRYDYKTPALLGQQQSSGAPFSFEYVKLKINAADHIAHITINRPDKLNALDPETMEQLEARFNEAHHHPKVSTIVIKGAGKAFVAGADVKFFVDKIRANRVDEILAFSTQGQRVLTQIAECNKRVICQLDGMALGGGAELALACHMIVASVQGSMAFPEAGLGIYPGLGGTQRLTKRVGKGIARYLLYCGITVPAEDLKKLGIVWRVVARDAIETSITEAAEMRLLPEPVDVEQMPKKYLTPGHFLSDVPIAGLIDGSLTIPGGDAMAKTVHLIRTRAPNALLCIEQLTDFAMSGTLAAGLHQEAQGLESIFTNPNALEGMQALLDRRRPRFRAVEKN